VGLLALTMWGRQDGSADETEAETSDAGAERV
jgi:hypothetical protein